MQAVTLDGSDVTELLTGHTLKKSQQTKPKTNGVHAKFCNGNSSHVWKNSEPNSRTQLSRRKAAQMKREQIDAECKTDHTESPRERPRKGVQHKEGARESLLERAIIHDSAAKTFST